MPYETMQIETSAGHRLAGALELPPGEIRGGALFAHCFTCTKQSKAAVTVSRTLALHGIATLRFDFTGLGGSEGEFGNSGFSGDVADLVASAKALIEKVGPGLLLIGHSLGGAAVLSAASELGDDSVAAVATIGAPSDVPHVLHNIHGDLETIERDGQGEVNIGGRSFQLRRKFLEETREIDLLSRVSALRLPILFAHSPTDQIVGIEHASRLYDAAKHPKSFLSLAGADHLLTDASDAEFVAAMIATWAQRYLQHRSEPIAPGDGVLSATGHGKFGTQVVAGRHRFIADEPKSYGGEDAGPTPYDLLGAALGTCTAMTMKMYADRKGLPLEGVEVRVTHERDHAAVCEDVALEETGMPTQALHRKIAIHGDALSTEDRRKIVEIADKCPVHRTLEGALHIHTVSGED